MPKVKITNTKGLVQEAGSGLTVESVATLSGEVNVPSRSGLTLGNTAQAVGVLTAKINTGIINHSTIRTTPAPAASLATGAHVLTAVNLGKGFCIVTGAHATTSTVTLPTKAHMIALMGGSTNITVGDTFVWYLHNAATTVNHNLVITGRTDLTIVGSVGVAANLSDAAATWGGSSTATLMTRITNVDGSCITYRLA